MLFTAIINKLLPLIFLLCTFFKFNAQVFVRTSAFSHLSSGVQVHVNGDLQNAVSGQYMVDGNGSNNNAVLFVNGDITNDATMTGNGFIRLTGDWFDNAQYIGGTGTVFLEGGIQILGGSSVTVFNNLTLDGTDFKIQQVDKAATGTLDLKGLELKTETFQFRVLNPNPAAIARIATTPTSGGFVSSLNGGYLHRTTNNNSLYLFPVGSSVGVTRYRPVEITPLSTQTDTFMVRMANVDPSIETYDRNIRESNICGINNLFYHQILKSTSVNSANIAIQYIESLDGVWTNLGRWQLQPAPVQWNMITTSSIQNNIPFHRAVVNNWNNFSNQPYALINAALPPAFSASSTSGCAPQQITFNAQSSGSTDCVWSFSDGTVINGCSDVNHTFQFPGCFDVSLTSTVGGCTATNTLTGYICVDALPSINFSPNPAQFSNSNQSVSFLNQSNGANNYIWDFGDGNTQIALNPTHYFTNTTNGYTVTLTGISPLGCTATQTVFIDYEEGGGIYIPNSFTPDGDGYNQTFKPVLSINFDRYNYRMEIYNRWGELVFVTLNPDYGWDGSLGTEGRDVQDGTYIYKIVYKNPSNDRRKEIVGHVNLIR
jgi:gliding motility-associated-like protein